MRVRLGFSVFSNIFASPSYDLDMDTRLSEETTTLVESYTVSGPPLLGANAQPLIPLFLTTFLFCRSLHLATRRPNDQSWL
jgi:hypothetical protein